jgi:hypothetical protein
MKTLNSKHHWTIVIVFKLLETYCKNKKLIETYSKCKTMINSLNNLFLSLCISINLRSLKSHSIQRPIELISKTPNFIWQWLPWIITGGCRCSIRPNLQIPIFNTKSSNLYFIFNILGFVEYLNLEIFSFHMFWFLKFGFCLFF